MTPTGADTLLDQQRIRSLIDTYYLGLDTKTFELIRETLADRITLVGDYSDPVDVEGEIVEMSADDWIDKGPRRFIAGMDATAHISTNHLITVDGDAAHARVICYANHFVTPTPAEQEAFGVAAGTISCIDYIFIDYWLSRPPGGEWRIFKSRSRTVAETGDPATCFGISLKRTGREDG
jgi:hypothetical protein